MLRSMLLLITALVIFIGTSAVQSAFAEDAQGGGLRHPRFGVVVGQFVDGRAESSAELLRAMGVEWVWGMVAPSWREVQWAPGGGMVWRARPAERQAVVDAGLLRVGAVGAFPPWLYRDEAGEGASGTPETEIEMLQRFSDYARFVYGFATYDAVGVPFFSALPRGAVESLSPRDAAMYVRIARLAFDATSRGREIGIVIELVGLETEPLRRMLEEGAADRIDAILIHWEGAINEAAVSQAAAALDELRGLLARHGSHAELWVRLPGGADLFGEGDGSEAAAAMARNHLLLLHLGFDRLWVEWESLWGGGAGMVSGAESLPPPLQVYATLLRELEDYTYLGRLQTDEDVWLLVFSRDGRPLLVGWTTGRSATVTLNVNVERLIYTDMFGHAREESVPGGRLSLHLNGDPVFVHGGDTSLISRALLDDGIERLVAPLLEVDPSETAGRVESGLQRAAIEVWFAAERDFREERERAGGAGSGGADPAVGWLPVANDLGIGVLPEPNTEVALEAWADALTAYLEILRREENSQKVGLHLGGFHVSHGLPVFAELGAALGLPWESGEAEAAVTGSAVVIAEARRWLTERQEGSLVRQGAGARLMSLAEAWGARGMKAASEAAGAMWSLVARETAALAVLRTETSLRPLFDGFIVATASVRVPLSGATLALVDPALHSAQGDDEVGPTALLRQALRPPGLTVPAGPDDPVGMPLVVGGDGPQPLSILPVEEVVWQSVEISAMAYRSLLFPQGEWRVRVEAPEGWMWQSGLRTYQAGEVGVVEGSLEFRGPARSSPAGTLTVQELDLRILLPSVTPPGLYQVHIIVTDPVGGQQRVPLLLTVQ